MNPREKSAGDQSAPLCGLVGGADNLSAAKGSFSSATKEAGKKNLERSGTKAKVGKGRRSDGAQAGVDSAGDEERGGDGIHGGQGGGAQLCQAGRATPLNHTEQEKAGAAEGVSFGRSLWRTNETPHRSAGRNTAKKKKNPAKDLSEAKAAEGIYSLATKEQRINS